LKEVVIIDAARTPIGKYRGSLSSYSAVELGTFITTEILERTGINKEAINQVIFGNVLHKNRYGFIAVDLDQDGKRTIKKSGHWFKEVATNNGFDA